MTSTINTPPAVASAAGEGRAAFVDAVLNDFVARTGMSVADNIREFILDDVLVPDDQWEAAVGSERLGLDDAYEILTQALSESANRVAPREEPSPVPAQPDEAPEGETSGGPALADRAQAARAFEDVIHARNCPFPFIFC
jgi:hypothetical protein